ncbi:MAG TPA: flagellar biosynthetic protein FliO [bacterium]
MEAITRMMEIFLLVFFFAGIAWFLLFLYRKKALKISGPMRIKNVLRLDSKNAIYLIDSDGKSLMIGVSPAGIRLLYEPIGECHQEVEQVKPGDDNAI